jgi:hypothetical protein
LGKQYYYPKWGIFVPYGFLILFPVIAWFFVLKEGMPNLQDQHAFGFFLIVNIFLLAIAASIILWLVNLSKTRIDINDMGLSYKSLFVNIKIRWADISAINKKYLYGGSGKYGGPPGDLEITTRDRKSIKVLSILTCADTGDMERGIEDFEAEIKKHKKIDF